MRKQDLTVPGLIHDLNNVFQTLIGLTDGLPDTNAKAILRNVQRGMRISRSLEAAANPGAPFETILEHAIVFVQDTQVNGPKTLFHKKIAPEVCLRRDWAWERVLVNLFLNAVRAMPDGGTIEVEAKRHDSNYLISVCDTGCGITPSILTTLFEPHVTTKAQGGLGLHVVWSIIQEDHGTIVARNRENARGAEFLITLPIASAGLAQKAAVNGSRR